MVKFWAVWRHSGGSPPSKRHNTYDEAVAEALRLSKSTHESYYVLEVIGAVVVPEAALTFERM